MEKAGGRPRDEVWQHVTVLEGRRKRVKCNYCGYEFAASANRIKSHINKDKGKGIRVCPNFPQSHNLASDNKGNSNHLKDNFLHSQGFSLDGLIDHGKSHEVGQIQGDAKYEERIQVGSSSVSTRENEYLQVLQYVFECLSSTDKVYESGCLNLNQKEFITLKPGTFLDSVVIDIFVEILTESEKKKATPSNWYLPVMFSTAALLCDEHNFNDFVHRHKMRENYIFDHQSPEKVFIPVHTGQERLGHFYLYIFHLNKKVVEIWDSLPTFVAETDRDETTQKLFFAMEILFNQEKGGFSDYQKEMANDILFQDNGFDCGVFVINYMQQSDNYVKRDSSFKFDSQKEREDLALQLLNNDLNKEKQNLYDKARRHYAQVETRDDNKRLRLDTSKEYNRGNGHDDLENGSGSWSSSLLQNSGSEEDLQVLMDQRKRMISNVEWASRSCMRGEKHLEDSVALLRENQKLLTTIDLTTEQYLLLEFENSVLRAQTSELIHRLESLNEIIDFIAANSIEPNGFFNPMNMDGISDPSDHGFCRFMALTI